MTDLDLEFVRAQFPGLQQREVFFDNAGGSITLGRVADRVRDYLLHTAVQLGATYGISAAAAERYREARGRIAEFVGAARSEEIVFGPSSTILLKFLAEALAEQVGPGDEIVVTRADHESNIGCWIELARRRGAEVRFWELNDRSNELELDDLAPLLNGNTRLVAMTHVSNIFGTIHPIAEIATLVHERGAQICIDGVAYAPHRPLELTASGVDYYVCSLYKVYGPHHAVLYGRHDRLLELSNINHEFFTRDQVPGKLEPGNANYELSYGAAGIVDYFEDLGGRLDPDATPAIARRAAWDAIARHEENLAERLLAFLRGRGDVTIHGRDSGSRHQRVPTISFSHTARRSAEIVRAMDQHGIGIRYGHFYAARLIDALGLPAGDGVVRASMVHYNTTEEVDRLVHHLEEIL